ncbi:DUF6078 family protein [Bacteroides fluxus]|jgi:hypothetical protein|uniref:Uncharacterized protein n=1 Tax=Bacteroides fluxus YIT 12057 TaxID=763034 RepID=F3PPB7_9BACE|nr:DUF6078 family protein [Bacteroides fluxus]EGF59322.1 hypothetical protein HMPREF9446_00557 [Bacteroides fluxus YIT 12057]MDY3789978.1 DUF6078 family protein [Bacteroides fluxus]
MKEEIDFNQIPFDYPLCLNERCPQADGCLRQLSVESMPAEKDCWSIISPKRLATIKGDCPFFRSSRKVRYAKGFMNILDNLPYNQRRSIIVSLIAYFGQRTYYRSRKGERLLTPDEQQAVLNIIKRHNATTSQEFDGYEEDYLW